MGDVICKVNGKMLSTVNDFREAGICESDSFSFLFEYRLFESE